MRFFLWLTDWAIAIGPPLTALVLLIHLYWHYWGQP